MIKKLRVTLNGLDWLEHHLFSFCVYLQAEAGGYSRRANLASQTAGRHTHPGCAVDLGESGASSRHLPLSLSQYQDTGPAIIQTHPHRTAPQV